MAPQDVSIVNVQFSWQSGSHGEPVGGGASGQAPRVLHEISQTPGSRQVALQAAHASPKLQFSPMFEQGCPFCASWQSMPPEALELVLEELEELEEPPEPEEEEEEEEAEVVSILDPQPPAPRKEVRTTRVAPQDHWITRVEGDFME
jgi:hypothetical protein